MLGNVLDNLVTVLIIIAFGYWIYSSMKDKEMKNKITDFFKGGNDG